MNMGDQDFIVSGLLSELKEENIRKSKIIKGLLITLLCFGFLIASTAGAFLLYLNQYDFTSTESITASGIYTLVDSNGNVVAQDMTSQEIMEVINGQSNQNSNTDQN